MKIKAIEGPANKSDAQAKEDQPAQIHVLSNLSTRKEKMPPKPPDKGLSSPGVKLQRGLKVKNVQFKSFTPIESKPFIKISR